jgi:CspA family cold shock protein
MNKNEIHYGIVKFYNVGRNYGFIIERGTTKEIFVCAIGLVDHIKAGSEVSFKIIDVDRGFMATEVRLINNQALNIEYNGRNDSTEYRTNR